MSKNITLNLEHFGSLNKTFKKVYKFHKYI